MDTREHILEAALNQFYRYGFHASGVDQLSQQAGVTKRTLYKYYPGKDNLIESVLQLRDQQFMARMQSSVEAVAPPERPRAYLDFLSCWGAEADFHGCMFINAAAEYSDPASPPHRAAQAHKERVRAYLTHICTEAGLPRPERLGEQLFVLGEGLIVVMQTMGHVPAPIEAARNAWALLEGNPAPAADPSV